MLKELENIEASMVDTIFLYNKESKLRLNETMKSVIEEHKSGYIDPTKAIGLRVRKIPHKRKIPV